VLLFPFTDANAQRKILTPSDSYSSWYNLEEWIYVNSNLSYRSYDLVSFDVYHPGYSNGFEDSFLIYINGNRFQSRWLDKASVSFPIVSLSDIDSVIVDYSTFNRFNTYSPNGTIEIYTKRHKNSFSIEHRQANQINDPGPNLTSSEETPNVELLKYDLNSSLNLSFRRFSSILFYSYENYNRTNQLVYDREANSTLLDRTLIRSEDGEQLPNRTRFMYGAFSDYDAPGFTFTNSIVLYDMSETHLWHPISGIEVPSYINQYQLTTGFSLKNSAFYKGSSFSYSTAESDSLYTEPAVSYGLQESRFLHQSDFSFSMASVDFTTSLTTNLYSVKDQFTEQNYTFLEYGVTLKSSLTHSLYTQLRVSNAEQVAVLTSALQNDLSINFSTSNAMLNKNYYTLGLWNDGIGFNSLTRTEHSVISTSDFRQTWSELKIVNKRGEKLSGFVFARHYWNFIIENIDYILPQNGFKLNSDIVYTNSKHVGLAGFQFNYATNLTPTLSSKTMLGGNAYLYGNERVEQNYESVARFIFSEQLQFKPDENVAFELLFRYLPARYLNEYTNLEEQNGWPPVRVRPIKMLNASVTMWFFDRFLELNLSLRNLLNSTESYDTNGQYYNMSMTVSGRINFKPKRLN
jgi:hypothetical protein